MAIASKLQYLEDFFGVYGKKKTWIFIWKQISGPLRPFHNAIKSKLDLGHNGPPPGNNVIPEPGQDRVNLE